MPKSIEDLRNAATNAAIHRSVKGSVNTSENISANENLEENKKARAKAMRLLEHMDRTEKGLYEKMRMAGFSETAIADAMAYVKSYGYINDLRYAETYLRTRITAKSRQQLTMELLKKGVDKHTIELAWEETVELEEPDERVMIQNLILKKYAPQSVLDVKTMRRLYGQLLRKGFRSGEVAAVLKELEISCSYTEDFL